MGFFDWFRGKKKVEPARTKVTFQQLAIEISGELDGVVTAEPHPDPDDFAILVTKGGQSGQHTTYLTNVWRQLSEADVDEQRDGLRHFLESTLNSPEIPDTWEGLSAMLLPVLRSAGLTSWAMSQPQSLIWKPATPYLVELLVIDLGPSVAYVTDDRLEEWGVDAEEAFRVAHENLARIVPSAPESSEDGPRLFHIMSGQIDGGSYMLSPGWLASYADAVGGRPIAWAGGRDSITIATAGTEEAVASLAEMALADWNGASRPLSPCLYTVTDDDRVVPLSVPDDHAAAAAVAKARLPLAGGEYGAQKEALDERHRDELVDVFVASLMALEPNDGGKPITLSVWTEGLVSWLPRTEQLALMDPASGNPPLEVPFDAVLEVAGDCLEPVPGIHPQRFETVKWPSPEQIDALRQRAT